MTPGTLDNSTTMRDRSYVRASASGALVVVLLIALGCVVVLPLYWLGRFAVDAGLSGVDLVFGAPRFKESVVTTAVLAFGSVVIALLAGTSLGWTAHRLPAGRRWLQAFPLLPLLIPAVDMIVGWGFLASPRVGFLNSALRATPFFDHLERRGRHGA